MRLLKVVFVILLLVASIAALVYSLGANGLLAFRKSPGSKVFQEPSVEAHLRKLDLAQVRSNIRFNKEYVLEKTQQALATYDKFNPTSAPWYADGRVAVELFMDWAIGEDFYGEGLLQTSDDYAKAAYKKGCRDALILAICDVHTFQERFSIKLDGANKQLENTNALLRSEYPHICKLKAAVAGFRNTGKFMSKSRREQWKEDMNSAAGNLQMYLDSSLSELASLIKEGCPERLAYRSTESLVDAADRSATEMDILNAKIEPTLKSAGASDALVALCQGSFLTDWAWTARGSGWANTVTPGGWRLMEERLAMAQEILESGENKFPENPAFPVELLSVELGQGMGKFRMEKLFNLAVKIDPGNYSAYSRKMYYLQPRWHGSPREVFEFGLVCLNSGRWSDKIPLVFVEGVDWMAEQDESLIGNPQIWSAVSFAFQEFLDRYPESIFQRTKYLKWAVQTKNWEVAREQLKLLGSNWDRSVLDASEFKSLAASIPQS
jgi:hypothetical protein